MLCPAAVSLVDIKKEDDVLGNGRYRALRRSERVMPLRRESVETQSLQASQEITAHSEGKKLVLYQYSFSDHVGFNIIQTAAAAVWKRVVSKARIQTAATAVWIWCFSKARIQTAAIAVWIRLISELSLGRCLDTGFCFEGVLCVW